MFWIQVNTLSGHKFTIELSPSWTWNDALKELLWHHPGLQHAPHITRDTVDTNAVSHVLFEGSALCPKAHVSALGFSQDPASPSPVYFLLSLAAGPVPPTKLTTSIEYVLKGGSSSLLEETFPVTQRAERCIASKHSSRSLSRCPHCGLLPFHEPLIPSPSLQVPRAAQLQLWLTIDTDTDTTPPLFGLDVEGSLRDTRFELLSSSGKSIPHSLSFVSERQIALLTKKPIEFGTYSVEIDESTLPFVGHPPHTLGVLSWTFSVGPVVSQQPKKKNKLLLYIIAIILFLFLIGNILF